MIDSHAHLDMNEFDADRSEVIARALRGGLTHIITVGIDPESSRRALALAREHPAVFATAGCHPHHAGQCSASDLEALRALAGAPEVVAWGEIGLDFFRNYAPREDQIRVFEEQLALAAEVHLPVIVHDREAHREVLAALRRARVGERTGVVHCFSGDLDMAREVIDLGFFVSVPGTVTYPKAETVRSVAAAIPLERMLIETDAPFLAPVPRRGKRNEPVFVTHTAREIARLRGITVEEVARQTADNTIRLFGLPRSTYHGVLE